MFNPFAEVAEGGPTDAELVEQAKNGDRAALEKLILRHQAWVYNIAVRMVFRPHDAEEVTQEVLVKVITKLVYHIQPRCSACAPQSYSPTENVGLVRLLYNASHLA